MTAMAGWPTREAVERALSVLGDVDPLEMTAALVEAGLPDLLGVRAVADLLGVQSSNLDRVAGLPAPLFDVERTGRLWSADAVRAFDAQRRAASA